VPVVYRSSTLALAALEVLVHVNVVNAPGDLVAVPAHLPDGLAIATVRPADLPPQWRRYPSPGALADIGGEWIRRARTAVLAVPSAVIPQELNYLLNPRHPEFRRIRVGRPEPFRFDERLWRAR
jgi:RES domain-containing protein